MCMLQPSDTARGGEGGGGVITVKTVGDISSCFGNRNRYFKPNLDAFLTTAKCFLCLNLTKEQAQRCDNAELQSSTETNGKL